MSTTSTFLAGSLTLGTDLHATTLYGDGAHITNVAGGAVTLPGANAHVAFFDPTTAVLTSESLLATTRGGTHLNTSASTGIAQVTAGTWSVSPAINTLANATTRVNRSSIYATTVDATPVTIATVTMTPEGAATKTAAIINLFVACGKTGEAAATINYQTWRVLIRVCYNTTGAAMTVLKIDELTSGTLGTYTVTTSTSGAVLNILVTGEALTTVNWGGFVDYIIESFT